VADDDGRSVLEVQHLAQPGYVIGERGHRELGRGHVVAGILQAPSIGRHAPYDLYYLTSQAGYVWF
jgi:hypothetical protein